tara:strand:+ start:929 stop:1087 length:159 start_codon:yes stop_codon:yes gene_type:complete
MVNVTVTNISGVKLERPLRFNLTNAMDARLKAEKNGWSGTMVVSGKVLPLQL